MGEPEGVVYGHQRHHHLRVHSGWWLKAGAGFARGDGFWHHQLTTGRLLGLVWQRDAAVFARPQEFENVQYHDGGFIGGFAVPYRFTLI